MPFFRGAPRARREQKKMPYRGTYAKRGSTRLGTRGEERYRQYKEQRKYRFRNANRMAGTWRTVPTKRSTRFGRGTGK